MPRIDAEALRKPEIVYVASSLGLARAVEALLTERGVDYVIQVESLGRTTLFGSDRHGAAFYVTEGQASWCRSLLREGQFAHGVVEEAEQPSDLID
jgi:hypothetical protein